MIVDSFLAFNEIELARFRINYLWELTDRVIIGESRLTHSGIQKPLYFTEWIAAHPELQEKVKIVEIKLDHFKVNWDREIGSREFLQNYLKENFENSRAILSDLDEIPAKQQILDFLSVRTNVHFRMNTYFRRANFALRDSGHRLWNHGVMIYDHSSLPENGGRYTKLPVLNSYEVGGHFSYLGMSQDQVSLKLKSFAHSELETTHLNLSNFIDFCDEFGVDHLGRFQDQGMGVFEVKRKETFPKLLQDMYSFKPSWFHLAEETPHFLMRLFASATVSHAIKNMAGSTSARYAISKRNKNLSWIYKAKLAIFLQIGRKIMRASAEWVKKFFNRKHFERGQ